MASTPRPNRRLRLAVVGAAARGASRSDAGPKAPIGPRSQIPVFVIKKGRYTGFDAPGPVGNDNLVKINNRGQIAGATSTGPPQRTHGFLLRDGGGGPFTPIDVPGAPGTGATGINDAGTMVGNYTNPMARPARNQPKPPMGRTA